MTHVERPGRLSTLRLANRPYKSRWILTTLAAVVVSTSAVTALSRPAGALTIAQEKQRAADLYNQIQRVGAQVQYLGQKYDLAHLKYAQIVNTITNTKAIVAGIEGQVVTDNARLKADAVFAYVTNGSAATNNPLFNTNAANVGATDVYNQLATGNIGSVIASLKTNRVQLTQERGLLNAQMAQAAAVANAAKANYQQYLTLQANIEQARSQVEGQISAYYNAITAAAAAASVRTVTTAIATPQPPSSSGSAPRPTRSVPPRSRPPNPTSVCGTSGAAHRAAVSTVPDWSCWPTTPSAYRCRTIRVASSRTPYVCHSGIFNLATSCSTDTTEMST